MTHTTNNPNFEERELLLNRLTGQLVEAALQLFSMPLETLAWVDWDKSVNLQYIKMLN